MKNDPRVIYPGTSFYGGLTSPQGATVGMAQPLPQPTGLQHPPVSGGLNTAPLSSLFGQPMHPPSSGSVNIR